MRILLLHHVYSCIKGSPQRLEPIGQVKLRYLLFSSWRKYSSIISWMKFIPLRNSIAILIANFKPVWNSFIKILRKFTPLKIQFILIRNKNDNCISNPSIYVRETVHRHLKKISLDSVKRGGGWDPSILTIWNIFLQ